MSAPNSRGHPPSIGPLQVQDDNLLETPTLATTTITQTLTNCGSPIITITTYILMTLICW